MTDNQPNETNIGRGGISKAIRRRAVYLLQWLSIWHRENQGASLDSTMPCGYTIVEVLIFLAVSGLLLISSMALISGSQGRSEFTQATRDIESQIQDILNNVSTGYYQNTNNFLCVDSNNGAAGGNPLISPNSTNDQGANIGCTFLGHVLQFGMESSSFFMEDFVIVGRQFYTPPSGEKLTVDNLTAAKPTPIATPNTRSAVDATQTVDPPYGLTVKKVTYQDPSQPTPTSIGAVGFLSSFVQYSGGTLPSGSQSIDIIVVPGSVIGDTVSNTINKIMNIDNNSIKNPVNGINICMTSGNTNQYAVINVGKAGRANTKLDIYNKGSEPSGVCT